MREYHLDITQAHYSGPVGVYVEHEVPRYWLEVKWRSQPDDSWQHWAPLTYHELAEAQRKRTDLQAHFEQDGHTVTIDGCDLRRVYPMA